MAAFDRLAGVLGPAEVLCFSPLPDVALIRPVLDTSPEDLRAAVELNLLGLAAATGYVLPSMMDRGCGSVLATTGGAAVRPDPDRAVSAVAYAAESAYLQLLHRALAPQGVHVAQVTIIGAVGAGLRHEPSAVAEALWACHTVRGDFLTVVE